MFIRARQCVLLLAVVISLCTSQRSLHAQEDIIQHDWPMFSDPVMVHEEKVLVVAEKLIPTWLEALSSEQDEIRFDAVQTIRLAAMKKLPGLEITIDPLIKLVANQETGKSIRYTAASALVLLDAKQAEDIFVNAVQNGEFEFSLIVESSLIRWKSEPMLEIWRTRIGDANSRSLTRLAFHGLAANGTDEDQLALVNFATDRANSNSLRIEAAKVLAIYAAQPYLQQATELASGNTADKLVAAYMASPQPMEPNQGQTVLLSQLCESTNYAAAGIAAEALISGNSANVLKLAEVLARHRNPKARKAYVTALYQNIDVNSLGALVVYLDDADPELRVQVRNWLGELAEQEQLLPGIIQTIEAAVRSESWRLQEQGLHLAVMLDQRQVAEDALKLLPSQKAEVLVTSAWALRRLQVPETLAPILSYCDSLKLAFLGEKLPRDLEFAMNEQLAHLYQMFGQMKYKPASGLMQRFTRKEQSLRFRIRAAAAWALGKIWEGDLNGDAGVAPLLYTRLTDEAPIPPEDALVKRMCAISLARLGSDTDQTIAALHKYRKQTLRGDAPSFNSLHTGATWALTELTGEKFPEPVAEDYNEGPWLIEPFDPKRLQNDAPTPGSTQND